MAGAFVASLEFKRSIDGRCLLWVLLLELVKAAAVSWERIPLLLSTLLARYGEVR